MTATAQHVNTPASTAGRPAARRFASAASLLDALPERARERAQQALAEAFPHGTLQSVEMLHGGLSGSVVCKVIIDDRPYVLRAIMSPSPFTDPARQFACMHSAASAGVAPEVFFADATRGISICAFIPTPLGADGMPMPRDAVALGVLLRRLHRGPAFPEFLSGFQMIEGGLAELSSSRALLPQVVREVLHVYPTVQAMLQPHLTSAPCHNDLNPGNVLSGVDHPWLIDWDGACMGDPVLDVAGLIHWFGFDTAQRQAFLRAYHDGPPTPLELAKLLVMEQVSWVFYLLVFLLISRGADGLGDLDAISRETLPSFRQALGEVRDGTLRLQDADGRRRLSLIMAKQALHDMATDDFHQAMDLLRGAAVR